MCALVTGVQTCALPIGRRLPRHQRCWRVGAIAEEIAFAINMNARREGGWVRHDPVDRGIGQPRKAHGAGFDLLTLLCPFPRDAFRSEEHTSELQSLMRISYAVFCLKTQKITHPYY